MAGSVVSKVLSLFRRKSASARLLARFERDRTRLQEEFFRRASEAGSPRGLRWVRCDWLPLTMLLRERNTGEICLLAGVNISFEAIPGGDMEDVAAVSLLRDASAVFHLTPSGWQTAGRALFNMNPSDARQRLSDSWDPLPEN